ASHRVAANTEFVRRSVFALGVGDALDLLAEHRQVERLLEDIVEAVLSQLLGRGLVLARQADDERGRVGLVLAEVGRDLDRFAAAQAQVNDDRVRMKAAGENTSLEAAVGGLELV